MNKPGKRRPKPRPPHRDPRDRGPARGRGPQAGPQRAAPGPKTDWSGVAEWYDRLVGDEGSEYHREVVLPGVLRLLGEPKGRRIVDVACGQGVLCRQMHDRGAEVTGFDAAAALIDAARARGPDAIRYQVGDARELAGLPAGAFDAATCVLAIQNMHPIAPVFQNVARLLKPGGRFVLVMMHPCFRGPKETRWGWDAEEAVQFRRVDRYLIPRKSPIVTHPGSAPDVYTWSFHKPIESYVRALRNAGLLIDALEEWSSHKTSQPGPRAHAENIARKEIPMFMALRGIRVTAEHVPPGTPEQE